MISESRYKIFLQTSIKITMNDHLTPAARAFSGSLTLFHCTNDPVHGSSSLFFFTTDESFAVTIVAVFLTVLAFGIVCGVVFMLLYSSYLF